MVPKPLKKLSGTLSKSASAQNVKTYSKIALALGTASVGYAVVQETVKGVTRTLAPAHSGNLEWRWTNTEVGLAGQTLLFITAAGIASNQLKQMGVLTDREKKIATNAGTGLAVGRAMMGTSILDIGKRFEYLLDGEIGAAMWPGAGPAITMPANAAAAAQVVSKHRISPDVVNYHVADEYLQNRVSRGMPYSTVNEVMANGSFTMRKEALPVTRPQAQISNGMISFQPPMYL